MFNPVMYSMNRKQAIIDNTVKKSDRRVPPTHAALIVSQETDDGFLDIRVLAPEGERVYEGGIYKDMSSQHVAVVEAFLLLTKLLFDEEDIHNIGIDPDLISFEDLDMEI